MCRRERQAHADRAPCNAARAPFPDDLPRRAVATVRCDRVGIEQAARRLAQTGPPAATLEALHLATAPGQRAVMFFTHDVQLLSRAAQQAGLSVRSQF